MTRMAEIIDRLAGSAASRHRQQQDGVDLSPVICILCLPIGKAIHASVMMQRRPRPSTKDTMQVRFLYVSRAVGPQTTTVTASILSTAQAHNRQNGIGGVLCQGKGLYLQVLEGERSAVNRLYSRIMADSRHKDVEMLHLEEVSERRYADWSMALVSLADDDPMVQLKHPEFDPYSAPGAFVMTLVDELIASGHRIKA
jgi:hypothetical protein